ncbi:hypothetical protein ABK040_008598 [Willaertia magna]
MNQEEKLKALELENERLREYVRQLEEKLARNGLTKEELNIINKEKVEQSAEKKEEKNGVHEIVNNYLYNESGNELTNEQIARFSRHLLLPEIGVKRQAKLCKGSVLIVGAGGLGSPAALYLAAAGVGRIGFVDFDVVDTSNLHRQVIHNEHRNGMLKTLSAKLSCINMNSKADIQCYNEPFTEQNGLDLVKQYDVVMDASDNVTTRYLVNDACVLAGKPLVSGSAVRFEGQLTIYNYRKGDVEGPCYRCLYPQPPPPETVTSCSDGGVLGVVPGIIGCLQALEVIKLLMGLDDEESKTKNHCDLLVKKMLMFNAKTCSFRTANVRGRKENCDVCGKCPTITTLSPVSQPVCLDKRPSNPSDALSKENRITATEYESLLKQEGFKNHVLLDVRDSVQFDIARLPNAVNVPLKQLQKDEKSFDVIRNEIHKQSENTENDKDYPIYVMCRRGIASVSATKLLLEKGYKNVKNIDGGVNSWRQVDKEFPMY